MKSVSFSFDDLLKISVLNRLEIIMNIMYIVFKDIFFEIDSFKTLTFV